MRKMPFIIFMAPLLLTFGCDLQMPSAVQVKGSPEFHIASEVDIGGHFKDFFKEDTFDSESKVDLIDCVKKEDVTYIVYIKLLDQGVSLSGVSDTQDFTAPSDINLAIGVLTVSALDFGKNLEGFSFDKTLIETKLYLSGNSTGGGTDGISVELKINDVTAPQPYKGNRASGLKGEAAARKTDRTALPAGGVSVPLKLGKQATKIDYKVFVKAGDTIKKEWIKNPHVFVELAVWLPFHFIADGDGASVELPQDLFSDSDLFGRESADSGNTVTKMIESLSFAMKMNKAPFTRASLNLKSAGKPGIEIIDPISVTSMEFALTEKDMKAINDPGNIPFAPKLKLVFGKGGSLSFPRDFVIKEIAFKAKFSHTIDL